MSNLEVQSTGVTPRNSLSVGYTVYLIIVALVGWALASYDFNLLVLTMPNIASDLHLSSTLVGLLGFFVYAAEFVITMFVGYGMDKIGRRRMWQLSLVFAGVFTGLTYFVNNYTELAIVRALASGFAMSELAISVTLVNEQLNPRYRGLLYSVVQGGWPLGVFLASGVYLEFIGYGWRTVFLWGVIPIIFVIIARIWVKESDRFLHIKKVRQALEDGRHEEVDRLLEIYPVDIRQLNKVTWLQLFAEKGYVRRQLLLLTAVWLFYSISYVATNVYITYWLTTYDGWTDAQAAHMLLVAGGIGYLFYVLGGVLGEIFSRRNVLIVTGILTAPLNLLFLFVHQHSLVFILYFVIYQVTNGTWSGAGYAYWGESFPTRVRGTAVGFLGAIFTLGLLIGSLLWTLLISVTTATATWVIIAVVLAVGQWLTLALPRIKPGTKLEDISA
ncbi:MFS transporter [Alicyclobacillus shizuokensis]|uniref:MFS transporter n=1 Tax=Alicyclobacillus shizuokensis TaxID=392014 RepID=UPI0008318957|nr:MFS transporter [Alicyclobacillus shizuokensis]